MQYNEVSVSLRYLNERTIYLLCIMTGLACLADRELLELLNYLKCNKFASGVTNVETCQSLTSAPRIERRSVS